MGQYKCYYINRKKINKPLFYFGGALMSIVKEYEEKFISAYCRLEYEIWYQGYKDDVSKYLKENSVYDALDEFIESSTKDIIKVSGEPLLNAEYIKEVCDLVPLQWKIRIETSLNVKWDKIELLLPYIDQWIIDIKDSNTEIYKNYTGVDNLKVYDNVLRLSHKTDKEKLLIRIPKIPNYNTEKNIQESVNLYSNLGNIDVFKYRILNRNY